jgi:hypothetical protein
LERGEGIEGFDFVARGAEGDCLLLHSLRIQRNTTEDNRTSDQNSALIRTSLIYSLAAFPKHETRFDGESHPMSSAADL